MRVAALILMALCLAGWAFALVHFTRNLVPVHTGMGADMIMTREWMLASLAGAVGMGLYPGTPWWWGVVFLVGAYVALWVVRWVWERGRSRGGAS